MIKYFFSIITAITIILISQTTSAETLHILVNKSHLPFFINPQSPNTASSLRSSTFPLSKKHKAIFETYDNTADLLQRLKATPKLYDIIITHHSNFNLLSQRKLIEKLNPQKLTESIKPQNFLIPVSQKQLNYVFPYMFETLGLIYRNDIIKQNLTSWGDYFNPPEILHKKIGFYQNPQIMFSAASLYLGQKPNSRDYFRTKQSARLFFKLKTQGFIGFYYETLPTLSDQLMKGKIVIGITSSANAVHSISKYSPNSLTYVIPQEGSLLYIDGLCIASSSQNKELAYQFINFHGSPEVQAAKRAYLNYGCPSIKTHRLIKKFAPIQAGNPIIYPSKNQMKKLFSTLPSLPNTASQYWNTIFR